MNSVEVQQRDVLALIGQKELDKLGLQLLLDAARAEIARLTDAQKKEGDDATR